MYAVERKCVVEPIIEAKLKKLCIFLAIILNFHAFQSINGINPINYLDKRPT